MRQRFEQLLGPDKVVSDPQALAAYDDDFSEVEPVLPALVVLPTTVQEVQAVVRLASELNTPITPRVAGTNVGGLAVPVPGSLVVDLRKMNRILSVDEENMLAVFEPGVTQEQLKEHLDTLKTPLTLGYSLGPKRSSVLANCCLDGLTNRSLKYGSMGHWVAGFEVVLADGTVAKTGSWALSDVPFARSPFPDLSGLIVGWQGTTGIVTKVAFQLAPRHPLNERLFLLSYSARGTCEAMRRLSRMEVCDDIGGLSWPTGKMMLGVSRPHPIPSPGEPLFFLYLDITGETYGEISYKREAIDRVLRALRAEGEGFEEPLTVESLVKLNPAMGAFASFPTDLDFLTEHGGGGLTWVGTYGPLSRFEKGIVAGSDVMLWHGLAPAIVSRSMQQGHFGVLRFLTTFQRKNAEERAKVHAANLELLEALTALGFVMYKTPAWALEKMQAKMDPGFLSLLRRTKAMLDPKGLFNPGKLLLP